MEKKLEAEDINDATSDDLIGDPDDTEPSDSEDIEKMHLEEPLTEEEIEDIIADLLEAESKAAEAQEALEEESLSKVEKDVREELAETVHGDDLEAAVAAEMITYKEEWEAVLDDLETESANLLLLCLKEQLDGAGVDLPSLFKWIEGQVPSCCSTEAWKKRNHWVGCQMTGEIAVSVACAENFLKTERPVRRRHGKLLEEGASGFLQKKILSSDITNQTPGNKEVDWGSLTTIFTDGEYNDDASFGSRNWASVYLASTPQQAAEMGLKFPGVDEVDEIDEIDENSSDPFIAAAIANERVPDLSEEQKNFFRKVKEEDDANLDKKLCNHLKRRRYRKRTKQSKSKKEVGPDDEAVGCHDKSSSSIVSNAVISERIRKEEIGNAFDNEQITCPDSKSEINVTPNNGDLDEDGSLAVASENIGYKHPRDSEVVDRDNKRFQTIFAESDNQTDAVKDSPELESVMVSGDLTVSISGSDSDSSGSDIYAGVSSKRKRKKKIRRILDDAELGEETKRKIAIEKERQERLKSLKVQFSVASKMTSSASSDGKFPEGASVEVLGDALTGYVVNVVREKSEQAVRIPPSISSKLKVHQVAGIRFMWENIVQSIRKVKSGDKGLGCILAHTMGLGKTFQVIAFLYTAMRSIDLGLRTVLIVTPVNVLHNWRIEFNKWRPSELKPLKVFMLEDVSRERRAELLAKWRAKGGVFLIGYTAFRNLSLGKNVKDRNVAKEISCSLQDGPDILVCDEAHMIKNTMADVTQALKQVKCQRRIALTGSPLQNNLMEYYCMVDFVREGFLGSSHEFRNRFQNPIQNGQHTNCTLEDVKIMNQRSHILYEQLKGFVQRMDMNVVKKDLPPKTVFVIAVKLSPLQRKLYKRFLDVHGFTSSGACNEKIRKRSFFAGYQTLAQIWNHPGILQLTKEDKDYAKREDAVENFLVDDSSSDENTDYNTIGERPKSANDSVLKKEDDGFLLKGWWNDLLHENNCKELDYSGKMVLLLDILNSSSLMGDKVLVFSQSIPTLDLIEHYLSRLSRRGKSGKFWKKGKDWYRLDGRTESSERQRIVERFNEPLNERVKCTLISTRAGSLGINLHAANRVVIVDGSWNPTYDLQAIYRAWRYGQKKPVFAYRMMAHGTMEEKIYKRQVTKEGLAARVVDRQQINRTISKEEMLHLFEFGDEESPDSLSELGIENRQKEQTCMSSAGQIKQNGSSSDKLMENLLSKHYPRWIANYHEHETLLQENEDEKLSKEEQDMAWEVYRRSLEWEEVQRVPLNNSQSEKTPVVALSSQPESGSRRLPRVRNRLVLRKCTNLSHLLTLRSQGTKRGCSTVCGECALEIRWEDLNRDGKLPR